MVKQLRNQNKVYTIFFNNQLCIKLLNNVTILLKKVHAVRQCIDNGSFLKMTSFRQLVFTRVLVLISSLRPITGMSLLDGWLRMGLLPPPREFCRHILSCRELKAESFKRCLHSVLRGVSL